MNPYGYPANRTAPLIRSGVAVGLYPAYTDLYDSGVGGQIPSSEGYFYGYADVPTLVEVAHMIGAASLFVEQFSLATSIPFTDVDGSDFRTRASGFPLRMAGDRLIIRATSPSPSGAGNTVTFALHWGSATPPAYSQVGGWFDCAAGAVAQARANVGLLRPYKTCVVQVAAENIVGAIIPVNVIGIRTPRSAVNQQIRSNAFAAPTLVLTAGPIVGLDMEDGEGLFAGISDPNLDQLMGFDYLELSTGVIPAATSARIHWQVTCTH